MSTLSAALRLRVVTYNLLLGGEGRGDRILRVLQRADADVIALQEANDLNLVRRLARSLGMRALVGRPSDGTLLNLALLSRRPVLRWRRHRHPATMLRCHLEAEIDTGSADLPRVRVHCLHLAARFGERANGEERRMRELRAVLGDIRRAAPMPHLLLGDFNALAPGDTVAATQFFERLAELRRAGVVVRGLDGLMTPVPAGAEPTAGSPWERVGIPPELEVGIPRLPWIIGPLAEFIPRHPFVDRLLNRMLERRTVAHLLELGYVDCYRTLHDDPGYTCATWMPGARIDYVFADRTMAARLLACEVIGGERWPDPDIAAASDHFPVVADFDVGGEREASRDSRAAVASRITPEADASPKPGSSSTA